MGLPGFCTPLSPPITSCQLAPTPRLVSTAHRGIQRLQASSPPTKNRLSRSLWWGPAIRSHRAIPSNRQTPSLPSTAGSARPCYPLRGASYPPVLCGPRRTPSLTWLLVKREYSLTTAMRVDTPSHQIGSIGSTVDREKATRPRHACRASQGPPVVLIYSLDEAGHTTSMRQLQTFVC
ncbi:hypothetical protein VTN77DRAFT_378 [Rasamsonia byssochlamydoides]|uniref:uncharacterized protein n=1 Tax=Rasamsonia byssochlamydoides TaxID=89139 RepID=UPI003743C64A